MSKIKSVEICYSLFMRSLNKCRITFCELIREFNQLWINQQIACQFNNFISLHIRGKIQIELILFEFFHIMKHIRSNKI